MLQTRKQQVIIVSKDTNYVLSLTNEQLDNGDEIEQLIVKDLVEKHIKFIWSKEVSWSTCFKRYFFILYIYICMYSVFTCTWKWKDFITSQLDEFDGDGVYS